MTGLSRGMTGGHDGPVRRNVLDDYRSSGGGNDSRYWWMAEAARRPSARAVTTRSAPLTLSPPAKTPARVVMNVSLLTSTRFQRFVSTPGAASLMIGSAL